MNSYSLHVQTQENVCMFFESSFLRLFGHVKRSYKCHEKICSNIPCHLSFHHILFLCKNASYASYSVVLFQFFFNEVERTKSAENIYFPKRSVLKFSAYFMGLRQFYFYFGDKALGLTLKTSFKSLLICIQKQPKSYCENCWFI